MPQQLVHTLLLGLAIPKNYSAVKVSIMEATHLSDVLIFETLQHASSRHADKKLMQQAMLTALIGCQLVCRLEELVLAWMLIQLAIIQFILASRELASLLDALP